MTDHQRKKQRARTGEDARFCAAHRCHSQVLRQPPQKQQVLRLHAYVRSSIQASSVEHPVVVLAWPRYGQVQPDQLGWTPRPPR